MNAVNRLRDLVLLAKDDQIRPEEKEAMAQVKGFEDKFDAAMDDDFNTADAISAVFELVRFANAGITADNTKEYVQTVYDEIVNLCDVLGLIVESKEEILAEDIEKLIDERQAARKSRDFARADAIRDELLAKGLFWRIPGRGSNGKKRRCLSGVSRRDFSTGQSGSAYVLP